MQMGLAIIYHNLYFSYFLAKKWHFRIKKIPNTYTPRKVRTKPSEISKTKSTVKSNERIHIL